MVDIEVFYLIKTVEKLLESLVSKIDYIATVFDMDLYTQIRDFRKA